MDKTVDSAVTMLDHAATKAMLGILAMVGAAASTGGVTVSASLFGALTAMSLAAGAAFAASIEFKNSDPHRLWRLAAWSAMGPGWIIVAVMFVHASLGRDNELRSIVSLLVVASAALRVWRWQLRAEYAWLGAGWAAASALLALTAAWSGGWVHAADAISVSCAVELFGSGSIWLAEAIVSRRRRPAWSGRAVAPRAPVVAGQSV